MFDYLPEFNKNVHNKCLYTSATRGNTSVDESYEWDEVDFRVDSNLLGAASATHSYGGQGGVRGERLRGQPHSAVSFRELQGKGKVMTLWS